MAHYEEEANSLDPVHTQQASPSFSNKAAVAPRTATVGVLIGTPVLALVAYVCSSVRLLVLEAPVQ